MAARGPCPGCATDDNDPRHTLVMEDGAQKSWHKDCHAAKGCPTCLIEREQAGDLTGQEFREHLAERADEIAAAVSELPDEVHAEVFGKVS